MIEQCLGHRVAARAWFTRALELNPQFSLLWSPVARRAHVKRLAPPARRGCRARVRRGAEAHPLGNFTINRFSRIEVSGAARVRPLRPRHGRDPDLPGQAEVGEGRGRLRHALARSIAAPRRRHRRRPAGRAACGEARARLPAGRRRACARRGSRSCSPRPAPRRARPVRLPRRELLRPDRLEGDRVQPASARRCRTRARPEPSPTSCAPIPRTCSRARST